MSEPTAKADKKNWLIIFAALVGSVFIYGLMCFVITQGRVANPQSAPKTPQDTLRWMFSAMAVVALLASLGWMHVKTSGKIGDGSTYGLAKAELMSPGEFQTQSIIALALSEACTIYGLTLFFIGVAIKDFVPFAVGTLLVDLFYILPRGLKYWSSWEQEQKAKGQPPNSPFSQSL